MTRNYFTLKTYALFACLFAIGFFSFVIYSELDVVLKDNDNTHAILLDREVSNSDFIDKSEYLGYESTVNPQKESSNSIAFAEGVRLVKSLEDAQGNLLTRSASPGETIYYVLNTENTSSDLANNVVITDVIPEFVTLVDKTTYDYEESSRTLTINIGPLGVNISNEIRIGVTVNEVENVRDAISVSNQAFLSYNDGIDMPSYANSTDESPEPTVFCLNVGENVMRTEVLCGSSITLTAGDGFDSYTWTRNGAFQGNTDELVITEEGTYVVKKTVDCGNAEIIHFETVNVYSQNNISNPFLNQADNLSTCPSDGYKMPNIFLCNEGDTRLMETSFVDIQSISWSRLNTNNSLQSCPEDKGEWTELSNSNGSLSYVVSEEGAYRIRVVFQNGCFKNFYFNVYDGLNPEIDVDHYTTQQLGSISIDTRMDEGEYTYTIEDSDGETQTYGPTSSSTYTFKYLLEGTYSLTITSNSGCTYIETVVVKDDNKLPVLDVKQMTGGEGLEKTCDRAKVKVNNAYSSEKITVWSYNGEELYNSFQDIPWDEIELISAQSFEIKYLGEGDYVFVTRTDRNYKWEYVVSSPTRIYLSVDFEFGLITENVRCYGGNDGSVMLDFADENDERMLLVELYKSGEDTPIRDGNTSGTFPNLEPGDYDMVVHITIPGENSSKTQNCTITKSFSITQPDAPLNAYAGVVKDVSCWQEGDSAEPASQVRISNVTGGTPPYQYNIDGAWRTDSERLGYRSNDGLVFLKDANGCQIELYVDVNTYNAPPELDYSVVYDCQGNGTVTINATVPNDAGVIYDYSYSIDNEVPQDSEVFKNLKPGKYEVTVYYENVNPDNPTPTLLMEEDFGSGPNTSWEDVNSVYTYESNQDGVPDEGDNNAMLDDGEYVVTQQLIPRNGQQWLNNVKDPHEDGGRYLAINIGDVAGSGGVIYEKEIRDITPGMDIEVNLSVINLLYKASKAYDPEIKAVLVNSTGNIVSEDTAGQIDNDEQWHDVSMTLNAGPNEVLTLQLISYSTQTNGNDIAIDGIKTYQKPSICTSSLDLAVTVDNNGGFAGEITTQSSTSCSDTSDGSVTFVVTNVLDPVAGYEYRYSKDGGNTWIPNNDWIQETTTEVTIENLAGGDNIVVQVRDVSEHDCGFEMKTEMPIQVPNPIRVDADVDIPVGCGIDNGGTILVDASGGTGVYQYQLSDSNGILKAYQDENIFENVPVGSYTVTVRDTNQCTEVAEDIVRLVAPETIDFTAEAVKCYDGSNGTIDVTVINGNGNYQFAISPEPEVWLNPITEGGTTYNFDKITPGTYIVYVKDGYGCIDEKELTINPQMALRVTSSSNVSCSGEVDGKATLTIDNLLSPPYSYTVNGETKGTNLSGTTITLTNLDNGTYEVVVIDAKGCTTETKITIEEPNVTLTLEEPTVTPIKCSETGYITGSAKISANGGWGDFQYTLTYPDGTTTKSGSGVNYTFTGLDQLGTYTISVTDNGGCSQSTTFELVQPIAPSVTANATNDICMDDDGVTAGFTITGGIAPYFYSRDNGNTWKEVTSTEGTFDITVNTAQTIDVLIRDFYGCVSEASASVEIAGELSASTNLTKGLDCSINSGAIIVVSIIGGYGPYTYNVNGDLSTETTLNLGETSFTYTASVDGKYTFNITDAEGCTTIAIEDINPIEKPTADVVSENDVSCFGGSDGQLTIKPSGGLPPYEIQITGPNSYNETFVSNGADLIVTGLAAGLYEYTIIDKNECSSEAKKVEIVQPDVLTIDLDPSQYTCTNEGNATIEATVSGGSGNYQFRVNGGPWSAIQTTTGYPATGLSDGDYTIEVRDANAPGCVQSATANIAALPTPPVLGYDVTYNCDGTGVVTISPFDTDYTYSLDGGIAQDNRIANHNVFNNLSTGAHSVTVNYGSECTEIITFVVEAGRELQAGITGVTHVLCYGSSTGSITFEVSNFDSSFTYTVNGGTPISATTSPVTYDNNGNGLQVGDYTIVINDASNDPNCEITLVQEISQPLAKLSVTAQIVTESRCTSSGSSKVTVTVKAEGGTAPYQYRMDDGAWRTSNIFEATAGSTHTFEVRDNVSCIANGGTPLQIEEPETLSFDLEAIDCYQSDNKGWIEVINLTGNGDYEYRRNGSSWTDLPSDKIISGLPAGTHTIEIRDGLGCTTNFQQITIHPKLTLTTEALDFTSCSQGSITATASGGDSAAGYEYAFMLEGVTPASTDWQPTNSVTGITSAGTYDVYVRNNSGNTDESGNPIYCQTISKATVVNAPAMEIDVNVTQPICFGEKGKILMTIESGLGAYEITLQNTITGAQILYAPDYVSPNEYPVYNLEPGNYTMTVADRYGCEDVETFTIDQPVELTADIEPILPANCDGSDINDYGFEFVDYTPSTNVEFSDDNGDTWQSNPEFKGHWPGTAVRPAMRTVEGGLTVCIKRFEPYVVPFPLDELLIQVEAVVECNTLTVEVQGDKGNDPYQYSFTDNIETFDPTEANWYPNIATSGSFIFDDSFGFIPGRSYTFLVRDQSGCIRQSDDTKLYVDVQDEIPILIDAEGTPSCSGETTGIITFTLDGSNLDSKVDISWKLYDLNNQGISLQSSPGFVPWPNGDQITVDNLTPNTSYFIVVETNGGMNTCATTASGSANIFVDELLAVTLEAETERDITCASPGMVYVKSDGGSGSYTYTLSSDKFNADIVSTEEYISVKLSDIKDTTDSPFNITVTVEDEYGCTFPTAVVIPMYISQPPAPPTVEVVSCDPNSGATLTITMPPGGEEPYKYSIDGGVTFEDDDVFENLLAGIYDVVVKDNNGCESTTTAPVEIYQPMEVDVTLTQELYCSNSYAVVKIEVLSGGSGDFTYDVDWVEGDSEDISGDGLDVNPKLIQFGNAGTYKITVHDIGTGCDSKEIVIVVPEIQYPEFEVVPSSTSNVSCFAAENGIITVTATGDDGPFNFFITALDGAAISGGPISSSKPSDGYTAIFENLDYGEWTIQAVSQVTGCSAIIKHPIEEPEAVSIPIASVTASEFKCTTGNSLNYAVITVDPSGITGGSGSYTRFEFVAPDGTTVLQDSASPKYIVRNTSGGIYIVNVYDSNGCMGTRTIEIAPFVEISNPVVVIDNAITCTNQENITVTVTQTGGTANLTYQVKGTDNVYDKNNATGVFTGLGVGNYLITVTNDDTDCYVQTTHKVSNPDTFELDATPTHVSCYGTNDGTVTLDLTDLTGGYTGDFDFEINGTLYDNTVISAISGTSIGNSVTVDNLYAGSYNVTAILVGSPYCTVTATFNITQPDKLTLSIVSEVDENCNEEGSVTVVATGGGGSYEYSIDGIEWQSITTFKGLVEGSYTVSVRDADANSCSVSVPFDIEYDQKPEIELSVDNVCAEERNYEIKVNLVNPGIAPYTVSIDGGVQQAISFTAGPATITGLTSGNHTVEIYDSNGCIATGETQVEIYKPLRMDAVMTQPLYCSNNFAEITVTVEGGSGNFTYDVYHEDTATFTQDDAPLTSNPMIQQVGDSGTYTVIVYDVETKCETSSATVIIPPRLYPELTVSDYSNISCYDAQDGRIVVEAYGIDSPYTFAITQVDGAIITPILPLETNGNTAVFEGLDMGEYTIEATSQVTGCSTPIQQEIKEPQPLSISAEITDSCDPLNGYEITISLDEVGTAPYTLSVNGTLRNITSDSFDSTGKYVITGLSAGEYTIEIQDANGCTAIASNGTQTITPLEFRPYISALLDCETGDGANAVITLDNFKGSGNYSYDITGPNGINDQGDITAIPFEWNGPSELGDYTIVITDDEVGCSISRTVTVPEKLTPQLEIVSAIDEMCSASQNGKITVRALDNGTGPFTFEITSVDGQSLTTPIAPSSTTGYTATFTRLSGDIVGVEYEITATAANSCKESISETIIAPNPVVITASVDVSQFLCNAGSNITEYATITVNPEAVQGGSGNFIRYEFIHNGTVLQNGSLDHMKFTDLNGGTVTVNVYDDKGCSGTTDVTIDPFVGLDNLELVIDSYITCDAGEDITANVTLIPAGAIVNLQYLLEDSEGTLIENSGVVTTLSYNFTDLNAGAYFVTIVNVDTGCEISASHNITNPADSFELRAEQHTAVTCFGTATGTVRLSMFDHFLNDGDQSNEYNYTITGVTDTLFSISGKATNSEVVVEGLAAGTYEVSAEIIGMGCSVPSSRFSISQSNQPLTMIVKEVANVTCTNDKGEIYVNPSGGYPPYQIELYMIDNTGTREIVGQASDVNGYVFTDLSSGIYEAVVTDTGGCEELAEEVTLVRPEFIVAEIAKTDIQCNGQQVGIVRAVNVKGGAGEGNYYFALRNLTTGAVSDTQESPVFTNLTAGVYEIIIMDAWSCDFTTNEVEVTEPDPIQIQEMGKSDIVCKGSAEGYYDFKISGGTAPYDISLTDADTGKLISKKSTDGDVSLSNLEGNVNYDILIQDASGCKQTRRITIPSSVDLKATVQALSHCVNNTSENYLSVELIDSSIDPSEVMYALNSDDINDANVFDQVIGGRGIIHQAPAGEDQWLTIFYKGCNEVIEPSEHFTVEPLLPLTLTVNESNLNEFTMYPTGGSAPYEYFVDGISQGSEASYVIRVSGIYEVMIVDANGCQQIAQIDMEFIDIKIPNVFTPDGDGNNDYWPPSNYGDFYPNIITKIYDRYGRVVAELRQGDTWDGRYNGTELPTGDYWYVIKLNGVNDDREFVGHFTLYR